MNTTQFFKLLEIIFTVAILAITLWFIIKGLNVNDNDQRVEVLNADENEDKRSREIASLDPIKYFEDETQSIVGLESLKRSIIKFIKGLIIQKKENAVRGKPVSEEIVPNFIFSGSPGTGKTMFGRILSRTLYNLGLVKSSKFAVIHSQQFIGRYVGSTENNTAKLLGDCAGGVVFIDEAYQLVDGHSEWDYGRKALNIIMDYATPGRKDRPIIILAGYDINLERLLSVNPGFNSRFPKSGRFHFDDYSAEELFHIGLNKFQSEECKITQNGYRTFLDVIKRNIRSFSSQNARLVESFIQQIHTERQSRVYEKKGELLTIESSDILAAEKVVFDTEMT